MRYIYIVTSYLMMPFILLRLLWKSVKTPAYRDRLHERFGFFERKIATCIWVHAVSVGETMAAAPLIRACLRRYPHLPIVLTSTTPTGYERAKNLFGESNVVCGYMPYDLPGSIRRFLNRINPCVAIFIETELWPNLLHSCRKRNIPSLLANARLSERSAAAYQRLGSLVREMFANLSQIAVQAMPDAKRFIQLGAAKNAVSVCGNLKFNISIPEDVKEKGAELRKILGENRLVWLAASTHHGEEELILKAYAKLRPQLPEMLLILVPRHPERFRAVEALCKKFAFSVATRSKNEKVTATTQIYLGDTMGEMMMMYAASDFAFVGGSMVNVGGHNLLEPAALGKAIITGSFLFNFLTIAKELAKTQAIFIVSDYNELSTCIAKLFCEPALREKMGARGQRVVEDNQGALDKHLQGLQKLLPCNQCDQDPQTILK